MIPLLFVVGWLACSVIGYLLMRRYISDGFACGWTSGDRAFCIAIAILAAPIVVISSTVLLIIGLDLGWDDEARW